MLLLLACASTVTTTSFSDGEVVTLRESYDNTHLIRANGATLLVDAGLDRDADALLAALRAAGTEPGDVDLLIVTHGHADHAGAAATFQRDYGVPVLAGEDDAAMLAAGSNDPLCPTDATAEDRRATDQAETFPPLVPDLTVASGESLDLATRGLTGVVWSLPGHTPGSIVLTVGDAAFVGDLFRGSVMGREARTHYYMCDLADNRADLGALLGTLAPGATRFFPGHFGPVSRAAVEALAAE